MKKQLTIQLSKAEGALVRLLGLVERRGYSATYLMASPTEHDVFQIEMTVESQRPISKLVHQIDKLYDVKNVEKRQ